MQRMTHTLPSTDVRCFGRATPDIIETRITKHSVEEAKGGKGSLKALMRLF